LLILVRHGRTAANASGVLLGRADPPLDDVGEVQAAALAASLPAPAVLVTSPLLRARQTAAAFGSVTTVDERWIELDYGDLDGQPLADLPGEIWDRWRTDVEFTPPGGESLLALGARVRAACEGLSAAAKDGDGDVVVVTHVSPIKAALAWALGVGEEVAWRTFVAPASITRIGIGPRGPVLHSFNEVAHLSTPPRPLEAETL
jgi:broad specificity phosphatase PhoE